MSPLADTSPHMAQFQIELLRRAGFTKRAALARRMTANAVAIWRRGVRLAHPGWSEHDIDLFFGEMHYGRELAEKVRNYLQARGDAHGNP